MASYRLFGVLVAGVAAGIIAILDSRADGVLAAVTVAAWGLYRRRARRPRRRRRRSHRRVARPHRQPSPRQARRLNRSATTR
jgi:hypothetical protein